VIIMRKGIAKSSDPAPLNRQLSTAGLDEDFLEAFFKLGFTQHREILRSCPTLEEREFYILSASRHFWNVETLKHHLQSESFRKQGALLHNFNTTMIDESHRKRAIMSFKDELLLDFINIEDANEEPDERVLEHAIIQNIKKFIMALGADFSFIGNQCRLMVEEEEFFIDLLFFNRKIQSLVAVELKKGKFRAEYVGKMNFYLSALDEYVKQPHENPSVGIILCKEKNRKIVEFAFRDTSEPMGVVTYRTTRELPEKYRNVLPEADKLRELLE
jgi:predicted nuclease of restriction endonuclease-like (RecB) superfamily